MNTHKLSAHRVYHIWAKMIQKTCNQSSQSYHKYGGSGICVSEEWKDFNIFFKDMGHPLKTHSLKRINEYLGFSKDNCRWEEMPDHVINKKTLKKVDSYIPIAGPYKPDEFYMINGVTQCLIQGGISCIIKEDANGYKSVWRERKGFIETSESLLETV